MRSFRKRLLFCILVQLFKEASNECLNGEGIKNKESYNLNAFIYEGLIDDCGCNSNRTCIRKCCEFNYVLINNTCVFNDSVPFQVQVHRGDEILEEPLDFQILAGMLECQENSFKYRLDPESYPEDDIFAFQEDGNLLLLSTRRFLTPKQFCFENFEDIGVSALACTSNTLDISNKLNAIGMIISMPFLLLTFLIYAILPDRNLHGNSLMCYVITLFGAYLLHVVIQGNTHVIVGSCKALGICYLFFLMVSFFWTNVMSIDIWLTFSRIRGVIGSKSIEERKQFLMYSAYAWGLPLVFVIIVTILIVSLDSNAWYYPDIGNGRCWFNDRLSALFYFYGPLTTIIVANIILFIKTAIKIKHIRRETAVLRSGESKKHNQEDEIQRYYLYLKLFLAMGVNWSIEIITWVIEWKLGQVPPAVFYFTDFCNACYGVFIFFMFVFKKNIWNSLKRRYILTQRSLRIRIRNVPICESVQTIETSFTKGSDKNLSCD